MALKKTLAQRLFTLSTRNHICRLSTPSSAFTRIPSPEKKPDPGDHLFFQTTLNFSNLLIGPKPLNLLDRIRFDLAGKRIRLDGLAPPENIFPSPEKSPESFLTSPEKLSGKYLGSPEKSPEKWSENVFPAKEEMTLEDARKIFKVSQLEEIKNKIRSINKDCVTVNEFIEICNESCGSEELGVEFAKRLDESGHVIVLGKFVFLRPDQVVKVVQGLMPSSGSHPNDPRWKELEELEKQKSAIDRKAETLVRRELWCGLGYLTIQTAVFMRLTFWELTWDVMEPICFYITSFYFMAGYSFFLRTKIEPSFEGFFQSRFDAKQKKLMKKHDFNVERYKELLRAFYPGSSSPGSASLPAVPSFHQSERAAAGAFHQSFMR